MHELSIALSIVNLAVQEAQNNGNSQLSELEIEVGELAGVDIEGIDFSLGIILKSSRMNVSHKIDTIAAISHCNICKKDFSVIRKYTSCPFCGSKDTYLKKGHELRLKSIVVE